METFFVLAGLARPLDWVGLIGWDRNVEITCSRGIVGLALLLILSGVQLPNGPKVAPKTNRRHGKESTPARSLGAAFGN